MLTCRKCSTPLIASATGRPPVYCSVACRRLAEFEIKRLNRRLETYELERDNLRELAQLLKSLKDVEGRDAKRRLADLETTIRETEERFRFLLDEASDAR